MTYQYHLTQEDYLQNLLYLASTSPQMKKRLKRTRIILSVVFLLLGVFVFQYSTWLGVLYMLFAVATWFFYPKYLRSVHKRYYVKHIQNTYADQFETTLRLQPMSDHFLVASDDIESKISYNSIQEVIEFPEQLLIYLPSKQALILPKNRIENWETLRIRIEEIIADLQLPYEQHAEWAWK